MGKLKSIISAGGYAALAAALLLNTGVLFADTAYNYDVNGDGVVNVQDMVHLRNHLLAGGHSSSENNNSTVDYSEVYKRVLNGIAYTIDHLDEVEEEGGLGGELGGLTAVAELLMTNRPETVKNFLGYTITDINGDGVSELLVGEVDSHRNGKGIGAHIYTMYTADSNNEPVFVFDGTYRSAHYYAGGSEFVYHGSGGAAASITGMFSLDKNETKLKWSDFYFTDYIDNPEEIILYHNTEGLWDKENSEIVEGGRDKLMEISDEYNAKIQTLEFELFSTYMSDNHAPVSAEFSDKISHRYTAGENLVISDYDTAVDVFFYATEKVTDVKFLALNAAVSGDGNLIYDPEVVCTTDQITEETPAIVSLIAPGDVMPINGIAYVDSSGKERKFALTLSGKDGSLILSEF